MDSKAPALTVTDAAVAQLQHLMAERGDDAIGIRVGVRNGGCSGMAYTMDFAAERNPGEETIDAGGVTVLIDPPATMFLIGTEMDFIAQDMGSNFVFRNPNETGRCGCGESFSV
jgi:iron-sulfur cluster assembly protein